MVKCREKDELYIAFIDLEEYDRVHKEHYGRYYMNVKFKECLLGEVESLSKESTAIGKGNGVVSSG